MTAGVPGTGLGGLFYILAALFLPVRGALRKLRGQRVCWRAVTKLTGLALGVFAGIWATGWLLGWLLAPTAETFEAAAGMTAEMRAKSENILRWAALAAGFLTLFVVLSAVQVARLLNKRR
jgi:hypothetical protein